MCCQGGRFGIGLIFRAVACGGDWRDMVRVTSTVRRQWRETEGHVGVLLKTGLPAVEATAVAESIVADIATLIENDDSDMLSVDVQRTPKGPAILLTECGDLDRALAWISD